MKHRIAILFWLLPSVLAQTSARDLYLNDSPAANEAPLGARIQIRKQHQDRWRVVEPDAVFRAGDKVRIEVESKSAAHLYILSRGSDGSWGVLFPEGNLRTASRVRARQLVSVSAEFDNQPGQELVYVVLRKQPALEKQELIRGLSVSTTPSSQAAVRERDLLLETAAAPDGQAIFAVGTNAQLVTKFLLRHQ